MSQSETCPRNLDCTPLQNVIATDGGSFICVGYNRPVTRVVPQDRFCHCWKNDAVDEHGHWDKHDLLDTLSVITTALSIDENIRLGENLTEDDMNRIDLVEGGQ
ncbi:hypothetical protein QMA71_04550 [Pseudomonas otitidis]|uniref:hypothetical protein n=1 Tax=Metapseudomonas otitidis TaxID=319939 RepID=UPI00244AC0AC|nr:hypothetical protein [Pseudomonas otitidis]MDH1107313.1 hypothetical protein [Pseudomonas otitidis]MDH1158959.1 hypothetical protein [Pseudomonas otitidis]MDH1163343.1 hypothetical protein [Pseudomonas otitidis]MDI6524791.1 hypothetical protein [Pseudomonas otitidis]